MTEFEVSQLFFLDGDILRFKEAYEPPCTKTKYAKHDAIAFTDTNYRRIKYRGKNYSYHRLVWCIANDAAIPEGLQIDHIDRDPFNNFPNNLRVVSQSDNNLNTRDRRNKSGYRNIRINRVGNYEVRFTRDHKEISAGTYKNLEEALCVRRQRLGY